VLVYVSFVMVVAVVVAALERTRFGLRLRAVGENPAMVDAAGMSVQGLRYRALLLNGVLCGLAGSYLTLAQNASFSPNMTAGRGFMALAAMIFGKWRPLPRCPPACCSDSSTRSRSACRACCPGVGEVPVQLIQALPYMLTVVLLAGFIGRRSHPRRLASRT
jgi:ABC-type uncharacterized transport system permease subunit